MSTTFYHVFEDFQLIFMNHIRLPIRNQCGSHIIHGIPNPLAFQQNYSRYDGPSESSSFFTLSKPAPMSFFPKFDSFNVLLGLTWPQADYLYTSCNPSKSRVCVTLQNRLCLLLFSEYKQINEGGYFFGSVGLSVCLWITLLKKLKTDLDGDVLGSTMKNSKFWW